MSYNVKLTHDLVRENNGNWICINCGHIGATITLANKKPCTKIPKHNRNVLNAIKGKI